MTDGASGGERAAGAVFALCAFGIWGAFPVFFKAVDHVPAFEVLAHRIVWSAVVLAIVQVAVGSRRVLAAMLADRRLLATLALSATLLSANWAIFIWAIANDRVLESSLGYFINPLVNVLLGVAILRERLRSAQWLAVALAAVGVAYQVVALGVVPWVGLALAFSFGTYGLIRKVARVDALPGLLAETVIVTPFALAYLVVLGMDGSGALGRIGLATDGLLIVAGVVTTVPLGLFVAAARRLALSTLGLLQYIVPTGHFALAVFAYGEPFTTAHGVTFGCIWAALAIFTADTLRHRRAD